jgi:hypothetical protein
MVEENNNQTDNDTQDVNESAYTLAKRSNQVVGALDQGISELEVLASNRNQIKKDSKERQKTLDKVSSSFNDIVTKMQRQTTTARTMGSAWEGVKETAKESEGIFRTGYHTTKAVGSMAKLALCKIKPVGYVASKVGGSSKEGMNIGSAFEEQKTALLEISQSIEILLYDKKRGFQPSVEKLHEQIQDYTTRLIELKGEKGTIQDTINLKNEEKLDLTQPLESKYGVSVDQLDLTELSVEEAKIYQNLVQIDHLISENEYKKAEVDHKIDTFSKDIRGGQMALATLVTYCKQSQEILGDVESFIESSDASVDAIAKGAQLSGYASRLELLKEQYRDSINDSLKTISDNSLKVAQVHGQGEASVYSDDTTLHVMKNVKDTLGEYAQNGHQHKMLDGVDSALGSKHLLTEK